MKYSVCEVLTKVFQGRSAQQTNFEAMNMNMIIYRLYLQRTTQNLVFVVYNF